MRVKGRSSPTAQIHLTDANFLGGLATVKFGQTGYLFITNTNGIVIDSPRKSRILKHIDAEGGSNPATARAIAGFEGTTESTNRMGVAGLYAFKRLRQTNWVMGAVYPRNEAFAAIEKIERIAWLAAIALALLVGTLSMLITRRQLAPLADLHQHLLQSRSVAEYTPMTGARAPDEIGDLARTFDQLMAQRAEDERRLTASEAYLRTILAHAGDAFVSIDGDGLLTEWNRQAELTFGWTRAEVIGRRMAELIIPQAMREAHHNGFAAFRHTGTGAIVDQRIEIEALHRDGHLFPIELSVGAVELADRYVANAFIRDITASRAAAQRIAASEKFMRDVTDNLPALISRVDRDLRYTFANSQILRHHPKRTVVGRTMLEVRGAADFAKISA